jgi:hypothetical protein
MDLFSAPTAQKEIYEAEVGTCTASVHTLMEWQSTCVSEEGTWCFEDEIANTPLLGNHSVSLPPKNPLRD